MQLESQSNIIAVGLDELISSNAAKAELYGMQTLLDYPKNLIMGLEDSIELLLHEIEDEENEQI